MTYPDSIDKSRIWYCDQVVFRENLDTHVYHHLSVFSYNQNTYTASTLMKLYYLAYIVSENVDKISNFDSTNLYNLIKDSSVCLLQDCFGNNVFDFKRCYYPINKLNESTMACGNRDSTGFYTIYWDFYNLILPKVYTRNIEDIAKLSVVRKSVVNWLNLVKTKGIKYVVRNKVKAVAPNYYWIKIPNELKINYQCFQR
ncbi:MAG: hypothetical protein JNJ85_00515 [Candidatus Kapabacteria bacterium]|nr:hypothetical protein [Candidatus Kapabacteria bacterium]